MSGGSTGPPTNSMLLATLLDGRRIDALVRGVIITNVQRLPIRIHAYLHDITITEKKWSPIKPRNGRVHDQRSLPYRADE